MVVPLGLDENSEEAKKLLKFLNKSANSVDPFYNANLEKLRAKENKMKQIKSADELKNNHKYFLDDHYISFLAKFVESKHKAAFAFVKYVDEPLVYRTRAELFKFLTDHSFKIYEVN